MAVQAGVGRVVDGEIVLLSATGIGTVVIMRRTGQSKALATALHGGGRRGVAARQALSSGQDAAGRGDDQPGADQDRDREPDRRSALACAGDGEVVGISSRFTGKVDRNTPANFDLHPIVDNYAPHKLYGIDT
jgi:hypothetical protein